MSLTAEGCRGRQAQLIQHGEADLFIINNPRHIQYLSGLYISPLALSGWGPNFLLLDAESKSTLIAHNFIEAEARNAHVDEVIVWRWYDAATQAGLPIFREAVKQLNKYLRRLNTEHVAFEAGWLPDGLAVNASIDVTDALLQMRRTKDIDELELIRASIQAIEAGHAAAREIIKPGVSEIDMFNAIYAEITKAANGPVLPLGDYVSGERTFEVGGPATDRVLLTSELMILDIYPIINGYRADFTATLSVDGQMSPKFQALETALHAAISSGENLLKAGTKASDVYNAVKSALDEHGFGKGFVHHAGHGLGLGHPEAPYIVPQSDEVLLAGDVVTLEPGSYGEDFGARIEHNYLILDDGFERLTNHNTCFNGK